MNLYCIKCSEFTNNNIKMKREIDRKINLSFYCINCGFKIFETIDAEELNHLLKIGTIFAKAM